MLYHGVHLLNGVLIVRTCTVWKNLKFTIVSFVVHPFMDLKVMIQHKHVIVNVYIFHLR